MQDDKAGVGVFGIGLVAYWPQFEGLKERLEGYHREVAERISEWATGRPEGPTRHCALGIGHVAQRIEKLSALLDLDPKVI